MTEPMSCPDCNTRISIKIADNQAGFSCSKCKNYWATYVVGYAITLEREGE